MKKIIVVAITVIASFNLQAAINGTTRFAYVNSEYLISLLPETKKAETDLAAYSKTFGDELDRMRKNYKTKEDDFYKNEKSFSESIKEAKTTDLISLQQNIQTYTQNAEEKLGKKRDELLAPIMDKAKKMIDDMAKEKGIDYVFDTSTPSLIVAPPGDDLIPMLKEKYSLKEATENAPVTAPKANNGTKPAGGTAPRR